MRIVPLFAFALLFLVPAAFAGDEADLGDFARKFLSQRPAERAEAEKLVAHASPETLRRMLFLLRGDPQGHANPSPVPEGTRMVNTAVRFLELDPKVAQEMGILDASGQVATRVLEAIEVARLTAAPESNGVHTVSAPSVATYDRQTTNISMVSQVSFIQDYDVAEAKDGTKLADPIIGTIQDGIVMDLRAIVAVDKSAITCDVSVTVARLARPIPEAKADIGGHSVTIQLPEMQVLKNRSAVTVPPGRTAVVGVGRSSAEGKRVIVVLLQPELIE
jgi:hypothetical protein